MSHAKSSCGQHSDQLRIALVLQFDRRRWNRDNTSAEHVDLLDGVRLRTCRGGEISTILAGLEPCDHTNGADNRGPAVVPRRHHVGVKFGVPLHLHTVAKMVKRSSHIEEHLYSARRRSEGKGEKSHGGGGRERGNKGEGKAN